MTSHTETFDRVTAEDWDGADHAERTREVRRVIRVGAVASAAMAIQPLPLVDIALIAPIQIGTVQAIGHVHGYRLDRKTVIEILSTFGAGLVTQGALLSAAKMLPFLGWVITVPMAYALTWSIGEVSHHYFVCGRGVSKNELRSMFEHLYRKKRAEREEAHRSAPDLKSRLRELVKAHEAGLIDEEELQRKKEEILGSV